jgi:dihydroorotate dehydrogenase (fumarate)
VDPELYLNHIAQAKESVSIPVIDSVNAAARSSWVGYVRQIEQAVADALELNIYTIPADMDALSKSFLGSRTAGKQISHESQD